MKGKLMVMTIVTGVDSPWILGNVKQTAKQTTKLNDELGIETI